MALTNTQKEQIAQTVIKVLYSRFNSFPIEDRANRNAPFHVAFLQAFQSKLDGRVRDIPDFINLSSWMHGLNTTLGQSFFESVAHILCDGEKREFKNKQIFKNQDDAIRDIITELKNGTKQPSLQREDSIIAQNAHGNLQPAINFTADCFFETDTDVVAIELKSVRPNSGEMKGEKQKVLIGRAVLRALYPTKNVRFIFGFPFDPTADNDIAYDKARFLHYLVEAEKFLAHDDLLIADELWSFLASSNGAMQEILEIINRIATVDFMDKFDKIQDAQTPQNEKRQLLADWCQFSEVKIIDEVVCTRANCRKYNQTIFKTDGGYNEKRLQLLLPN